MIDETDALILGVNAGLGCGRAGMSADSSKTGANRTGLAACVDLHQHLEPLPSNRFACMQYALVERKRSDDGRETHRHD